MAKAVDELILEMKLDNKQVVKSVDQVKKQVTSLEKNVKKTSKSNEKSLKKETKEWRGLGSALATTTDKVKKHGKETGKALKGTGKATKRSGKDWLQLAGKITGFSLAARKALDLSNEFNEYKQGFDALDRSSSGNADNIIKKLREVSLGTIDNKNIMLSANKAIALGVTKDIGKMANLLEVARVKGKKFGLDTATAFNDIVTGIGRGSPLILDNLGIITKGWAEEAKAAGVAMDAQFILNKVLEEGAVELSKTGASALTAAERTQRFTANMKNMGLVAGKAFNNVIQPLTIGLNKLANIFISLPAGIQEVTIGIGTLSTALGIAVKFLGLSLSAAGALGAGLLALAVAYKAVTLAIDIGTRSAKGWQQITSETDLAKAEEDLVSYKNELNKLGAVYVTNIKALEEFISDQLQFNQSFRKAEKLFRAGAISQEEYANATKLAVEQIKNENEEILLLAGKVENTENAIKSFQATKEAEQSMSNALALQELANKDALNAKSDENQASELERMIAITAAIDAQRENELLKQQADLEARLELLKKEKELFIGTEMEFNLQKQLLEQQLNENLNVQRENTLERDRRRNQLALESFGTTFENISVENQAFLETMRLNQNAFWDSVGTNVNSTITSSVGEWGRGIGHMLATGEKLSTTLGGFFSNLKDQIVQVLVEMLAVQAAQAIIGVATGGLSSLFFAEGTDSAPGGPAVVGEKGPEGAVLPNGKTSLVGRNGAEIRNLPKGTQIIPNHEIRNMSRFSQLPAFAGGTSTSSTMTNSNNSTRTGFNIQNLNLAANDPMTMLTRLDQTAQSRLGTSILNK